MRVATITASACLLLLVLPLASPHLQAGTVPCPNASVGPAGVLLNLIIPAAFGCPGVSHAPILINGNSGFTAANGVANGSGTASDPYIISDWSIDGDYNSPYAAIQITGTTSYFVIRNVLVAGQGSGPGIRFSNITNGVIEKSTVGAYIGPPISLGSSENVMVQGNVVEGGGACVSPDLCDTADGVYALSVNGLTLFNNTISGGNGAGILGCYNVTVSRNTFNSFKSTFTAGSGLLLSGSTNVRVSGNVFTQNGVDVEGSLQQLSSYSITPDNLANGSPVYYYTDCSGLNVDGVIVGQLIIAYCDNFKIANLKLSNDNTPLQILHSNSGLITNNVISGSWFVDGAIVSGSSYITVTGNNFTGTNDGYYYGEGLVLDHSTNSTIYANNFINNHIGLEMELGAVNTRVFHNNFVFDVNCCIGAMERGGNTWDNGYPSGGNYWKDYTGSDSDNDGIGDTAASVCCVSGLDRYPFMKPIVANDDPSVGVNFEVTFHGVTVAGTGSLSISSGTVYGQISITTTNSSTGAVLFSKTYTITNLQISNNAARFLLSAGVSSYPLSADVVVRQSGGVWSASFMVTRQLDISGHGVVDITDAATLALSYGSSIGSSAYNAKADINASGKIDLADAALVAFFYDASAYS